MKELIIIQISHPAVAQKESSIRRKPSPTKFELFEMSLK